MTKTILILAANPKNTLRLRLDQEVREIDNGLQRARRRNEFILKQIWAVRRSDFRRAMLDLKPNIVHFCGHGSGEDGIAFEDENGQAKLIGTEALSGFFKLFADNVECVVLNACYSEVQAEAIAKHIPHVIGMNQAIGDTAAIEFSVAFYDALGAGKSIEFAYQLACNAIQSSGISENLTPILKSMGRPPKPVTQKEKPQINHQNIVTGDFLSLDLHVVNPEKYGFQSPQYAIYANDQFESIGLLFAVSVAVYNPNSVDMLIVKWTLKVPDLGILVDRLSKRSTIKIFPSGIIRIRASSDLVLRIPAREMVDGILLRFEHICPIIKEKFGLGFDPINVELTAYLMNNYRKAICNCKLLPLDYLNWSKNNE